MNKKHHTIVVTRGPLSRTEAAEARRTEGGAAYVRMCALGIGTHYVTTRELLRLTVSSHRDTVTDILFKFRVWQRAKSPFFAVVHAQPYGRLRREAVTVQLNHLEEFDHTLYEQQPDVENTGDVLDRFLFEFKQMMKRRADVDWDATGKTRALAKRVLSQAGGLDAALDLLKAYVLMPAEHRGDDLSFMGFYQNIPGILNIREMTAREEMQQRTKMQQFREEKRRIQSMTKEDIEAMVAENVARARRERGEANG